MLERTGVPTPEDVEGVAPSAERRARGPVAVLECFQNIPCNPCHTHCPRGAIGPMDDINERPALDAEACNGCGVCVSHCPGLAIFVVDEGYGEAEALVKLPYEFAPLPEPGDVVAGLDREGNPVCDARVVRVANAKGQDRTAVVSLAVPKAMAMRVRFFGRRAEPEGCGCAGAPGEGGESDDDRTYLCRCEEITRGEVRALIARGFQTLDEIKRISRAGMGPCQGRTCRQLILQEIERATGVKAESQPMTTFRPPAKPIKMALLVGGDGDE